MSTELLTFGGTVSPMVKAKKEITWLKTLTIAVKAKNKKEAAGAIKQQLEEKLPEHFGCYFAPKIWLDRPGIPRPPVGEFCDDFFETVAVWNPSTGEPEPIVIEHADDFGNGEDDEAGQDDSYQEAGREKMHGLNDREQSILNAVEYALSGNTNIFNKDEADELIAKTGQNAGQLVHMIMCDLIALEARRPHHLTESDIHYLTLDIIEAWRDSPEDRLDYLDNALNGYSEDDAGPVQELKETRPDSCQPSGMPLTYHQQLIIAALQGLCANPAYCGSFDDFPYMAHSLANGVINIEVSK